MSGRLHALLRFSSECSSLLPSRVANRILSSPAIFLQPKRYCLAPREDIVPSLAKAVEGERKSAAEALPVTIPKTLPNTRENRSVKPSDLYNALVHEGESRHLSKIWADAIAVTTDGSKVPEKDDSNWKERLEQCRMDGNSDNALNIVTEINEEGYLISARTAVIVIETCIAAGEYEGAEHVLAILKSFPNDHPTRTTQSVCMARTLLAMSFTSRGWYERALQVIGFPNERFVTVDAKLIGTLNELGLGRDSLAWGVLLKALTKIGRAETAVAVVDVAMRQGVGMTDSLLHLTIDSLRVLNRWKDAEWLFTKALEKGIKPSEMTLGSILMSLTSRDARTVVAKTRIEEIVNMAKHPSPRFMKTAIMALTSVGLVEKAENLFHEVGQSHPSGVPDEETFGNLMAGYGNHLQLMPAEVADEVLANGKLEEVNKKADQLWGLYLKHHRTLKIGSLRLSQRNMMIGNYLRVKIRSYRIKEAVDILEVLVVSRDMYPTLNVGIGHICSTLGAIELCCDVLQLERLTEIMRQGGIKHDMRSLAFAVGTYVGDGNLSAALKLVEQHFADVTENETVSSQFRNHHPQLLFRRMQTLRSALRDSGIKKLKTLDDSLRNFERRHAMGGSSASG